MRFRTTILALSALFALETAYAAETSTPPVRFGLTAAIVRENLDLHNRFAAYLGRKIGRLVQFEQRRTYREAMELLEVGEHDFSWVCSFPYAKYRASNRIGLMAVPVFNGEPLYRAYIVVRKTSAHGSIRDLEGKVFAYADPDSNTGYVIPRHMIREIGSNPDRFFRQTFFTYSHSETIDAVTSMVADGAAVNSYVWEYLNRREPQLTATTKVIQRSEPYGFPPLVYRVGVDKDLLAKMTDALLDMDKDAEGRALLAELMLDRFTTTPSSLYDSIRLNDDRR